MQCVSEHYYRIEWNEQAIVDIFKHWVQITVSTEY